MGNKNPKPTIHQVSPEYCQVQVLETFPTLKNKIQLPQESQVIKSIPLYEVTEEKDEPIPMPKSERQNTKVQSEGTKILHESNHEHNRPGPSQNLKIKLPAVRPPAKRQILIKKTKESKENATEPEGEIEELENIATTKSEYVETEIFTRGRTAPLVKSGDNVLIEFGKTKKCRVSRML